MIAICTAFKRALVAVEIDGESKTFELDSNCKHSENIMPTIDKLLIDIGKTLKDNDSYAVVVGPGSFTGIRIGISLIKGFLVGSNKKVVSITTNELMAYTFTKHFQPKEDFVTVIDGLSGNYFVAKFDKNGIKKEGEHILKGELSQIKEEKVKLSEENVPADFEVEPSAEELLQLAMSKLARGETSVCEEITPLYLRKSQAEDNLEKKE